MQVVINRPDKANALSRDMVRGLTQVFMSAAKDTELRVVTIEGAGGRVFCAGADLSELVRSPDNPDDVIWNELSEALNSLPVLAIAKINGPCMGGALTLALGCDIRIASPDAAFAYPVLRNNVLPAKPDSERLRSLVGPGRQSLLLLGGQRVSAKEALDWGLVDRIVAKDELDQAAAELTEAALAAEAGHVQRLKAFCRGKFS